MTPVLTLAHATGNPHAHQEIWSLALLLALAAAPYLWKHFRRN